MVTSSILEQLIYRRLRGPLRLLRLCFLVVVLPGLLVAVPLYLKYRVFTQHYVPLAMSDMRLMDTKISTTWCQRQLVTSNTTFNAYLLSTKPAVRKSPNFVNMFREMVLEDDMKEYWGFYLIKGSTVSISSCASRHGASLIVIRGHHHLRQCAYVGDNSSEEEEELEELQRLDSNKTRVDIQRDKKYSNKQKLHKARPEVLFTGANSSARPAGEHSIITKNLDTTDHDLDHFELPFLKEHQAQTRNNIASPSSQPRSKEVFKNIIDKIKTYQREGKDVLTEVKKYVGEQDSKDLRLLSGLLHNDVNKTDVGRMLDNDDSVKDRRKRRSMHSIRTQFNIHDELENNAGEEGVEHDEVSGKINGTTANDTSNSEFWSSFSSSEERLLECEGLIISQPLNPSAECDRGAKQERLHEASLRHKISYTVPQNGYYFFVFSSENEIESNFIHAEFTLEKMMYDVTDAVAVCQNSTEKCSLPLNFFSNERLVLELPVNDSMWNDEFIVVSTCEPRTALYVACIVTVPILILLFAF